MTTKRRATIEDLYNTPGKAELVNGEIIEMPPGSGRHNRAAFKIAMSLYAYELQTGRGHAIQDNGGFVVDLPNRESLSPDAAYYFGELTDRLMTGAPIFAVEVRSEKDYGQPAERLMAIKRNDYFRAGAQVVWDVDLRGEDIVRVYRADDPQNPTVFRRGEVADAEPALPGWRMPVDELLPEN